MKKRISALVLGIAVCLGLCVPAFAAGTTQVEGEIDAAQSKLTIYHPDNHTIAYKAEVCQVRELVGWNQGSTLVYGEAENAPADTAMPLVPLGADIEISGLAVNNNMPADEIVLRAWSDPDGDGIYDRRLIVGHSSAWSLHDSYFMMDPLNLGYSDYAYVSALGAKYSPDYTTITITSDRLCLLFGANTIFNVTISDDGVKQSFTFLVTGESLAAPAAFTDVSAGDWYADPVTWAVQHSITNGTTNTTFSPGKECTHQEILTFLYRAEGKPASYGKYPAAVADAYADAINWAYEKKMIDNSFDPSAPCTRADAVMYIWQAFNKLSGRPGSFTDVPADADYAAAVDWAVENGITTGYSDNTFHPDSVCDRGQIVTFLYRAYTAE